VKIKKFISIQNVKNWIQ